MNVPADAPGYRNIIKEPMDLSTIDKNIKIGKYDNDTTLFLSDVSLIWKNCVTYNDPSSSISDWARIMAEAFNLAVNKFGSDLNEHQMKKNQLYLDQVKSELEEGLLDIEEGEDEEEDDRKLGKVCVCLTAM